MLGRITFFIGGIMIVLGFIGILFINMPLITLIPIIGPTIAWAKATAVILIPSGLFIMFLPNIIQSAIAAVVGIIITFLLLGVSVA